jgi:hypothetical protein
MRTLVMAVALMTLVASEASALDINDKWGIGAAVFDGNGEVSLIRGKSDRSAWLFDVTIFGGENQRRFESPTPVPPEEVNSNHLQISAGPGCRRFTRPTEEFSPYWDVRVRGLFGRDHRGGSGSADDVSKTAGVAADFSFGLEYFTRWHFSVAAHSALVKLSWARQTEENPAIKVTSDGTTASFGLSPVIYVRGYF